MANELSIIAEPLHKYDREVAAEDRISDARRRRKVPSSVACGL
jgi:hypothetical protein